MDVVYIVIDWDAEEVIGVSARLQGATVRKNDYCDKKGIADEQNARSRVTVENQEVSTE